MRFSLLIAKTGAAQYSRHGGSRLAATVVWSAVIQVQLVFQRAEDVMFEQEGYDFMATTGVPTEPDDAIATARFIGGLRRQREQAGLGLGDVSERSGIDKASLSRLENGVAMDDAAALS